MWIEALVGTVTGYIAYLIFIRLIPHLEKRDIERQRSEVLAAAESQGQALVNELLSRENESNKIAKDDLEEEFENSKQELASLTEELDARDTDISRDASRVERLEAKLQVHEQRSEQLDKQLSTLTSTAETHRATIRSTLSRVADTDESKVLENLIGQISEDRRLECQKLLKLLAEECESSSRKLAKKMLGRTSARYAPNFYWPKSVNTVELASESQVQVFEHLGSIAKEQYLMDISVGGNPDNPLSLKLNGGFGIHREAMRLAIQNSIKQQKPTIDSILANFERERQNLENEATGLGKKACDILELSDIHIEIQKLVGALNWRTSYRQNQWYHTLEVATLAGILATELGIDPVAGKKVGLLHDIGKAIDYRIEGSHAIISGDYADRYGENRTICDTVMSHHADLIVETPLAYVLRAADTLSGARPGARVNLEEGYQIRIGAIFDAVRSFSGISDIAIMNGGREVHIQVDCAKIKEGEIGALATQIKDRISEEVSFPGQIKVLVTRLYEATAVA